MPGRDADETDISSALKSGGYNITVIITITINRKVAINNIALSIFYHRH